MSEAADFRRFLDKAVSAQRAVDEILSPPAPPVETMRERELAAHRACFTPIPPPRAIDRRDVQRALELLHESELQRNAHEAKDFARRAAVILEKLLDQ